MTALEIVEIGILTLILLGAALVVGAEGTETGTGTKSVPAGSKRFRLSIRSATKSESDGAGRLRL